MNRKNFSKIIRRCITSITLIITVIIMTFNVAGCFQGNRNSPPITLPPQPTFKPITDEQRKLADVIYNNRAIWEKVIMRDSDCVQLTLWEVKSESGKTEIQLILLMNGMGRYAIDIENNTIHRRDPRMWGSIDYVVLYNRNASDEKKYQDIEELVAKFYQRYRDAFPII